MACGNLGIANDFNIFVFGDHTQSNVDSEGRVAVGGNATYTDYGVGSSLTPISTDTADLIVQGNVNINRGINFAGNTVVYPTSQVIAYTMTNNNGVPGQPLVGTPIDFIAAEQALASLSLNLAAITTNGTIANNFGQIVLTGTDPELNVFMFNGNNVDGNGLRLDTANGINIIAPAGSTIIINISGDPVGFGSYTIFRNGITSTRADAAFLLWNFYQATTAFNQNLSITGSVLAPYADWEARGFGNINGTIVANSLTNVGGTLEAHHVPFTGCLPTTPTPMSSTSTTTTTTSTTTTTTTSTTSTTTATTTTESTTTTPVPTTTTTTTPVPTTTTTTTTPAVVTGPNIIASKTANITTAQVGDTITYIITVTNIGDQPGEAVLTELFPDGIMFIASSLFINGGRFSGVDITEQVTLGTLSPGQVVTLQFQVFVAAIPPNGLITNRGFVITVPPGTLVPTCNPGEPTIVGMQGVPPIVGETLPVLPVFKPGVTPTPGQIVDLSPITTASGKVVLPRSVTVPGITLPPFLGLTIPLLTGTVQPITQSNPVAVSPPPVINFPSLRVTKAFLDISLFVGQRITYSIFVVNEGNAVSAATTLFDTLSATGLFIPGTVRVNGVIRLGADPGKGVSLGPIPPGEAVVVRFDVLVAGAGTLTNTARVTSQFVQPNNTVSTQSFQSATISNSVSAIRAASFANFLKAASVQTVKAGDSYQYNVTLTNLSTDIVAGNVIFYDRLANQLEFVSGSLVIDGAPQLDPQVGVFLGTIGPGATRTLSFRVWVATDAENDTINNQAVVFFEFRFGPSCFRAGLLTNISRVVVTEEEEE
ncbi:choice-of-anchor A family protein [Paenibacillus sp. NEAU-GSW1]|uniref:choice-of-anchor A family protein n=1 Tax=Paenibacillus sp. NEAU-GSW1 TaxID=2682486 RepID=UPI0012E32DD9|nr:choice-of-anchor A family protein [Paenibacillus sp. NEAU-GSW1]MUT66475.1 choice-of-anchor A family protein [Paenibacillus sp. NEAU-GSW1]